jgi:hypothetical protein
VCGSNGSIVNHTTALVKSRKPTRLSHQQSIKARRSRRVLKRCPESTHANGARGSDGQLCRAPDRRTSIWGFPEPGELVVEAGGGGDEVEEDPEEALTEARLAVERVVASNTAVELTPRSPFVVAMQVGGVWELLSLSRCRR